MRYFSLEDLENQVVNNFPVDSLTFLELRSANAIRLTIDKTNVVCVPPDPFCHFTNLLSKFHLYVFACFFCLNAWYCMFLYVFGYCPYFCWCLCKRDLRFSLIGQEIGILEIRVWQVSCGTVGEAEGFWSQKKNNSFNKKPRRGGKTSCFWRLP